MRVKFNNNDTYGLNKKPTRILILSLALIFTLLALIQIFCKIFRPFGYERVVSTLENRYIVQLFFGASLLALYFIIKNSKPTNQK